MTAEERYALAKTLEDIMWSHDFTDAEMTALEQAIKIVSPEYAAKGVNSVREILFRGKQTDTGEWVYGWYCPYPFGRWPLKCAIVPLIEAERGSHRYVEVDPDTVGQFTGLKDKTGNQIFEGDILREPAKNEWEETNFVGYEVFWHDNDSCDRHIGWQMNRLHFYGALCGAEIYPISFRPECTSKMEVMGNIYDNPELLEGSK